MNRPYVFVLLATPETAIVAKEPTVDKVLQIPETPYPNMTKLAKVKNPGIRNVLKKR